MDDAGHLLAQGQVGEIVVRGDFVMKGYYKNPEATARAWRNGWFHTGDAFRKDAEGNYFFVDRMKDAIRRRGENISSFEVESEVMAHPAIRECAAVAVASTRPRRRKSRRSSSPPPATSGSVCGEGRRAGIGLRVAGVRGRG